VGLLAVLLPVLPIAGCGDQRPVEPADGAGPDSHRDQGHDLPDRGADVIDLAADPDHVTADLPADVADAGPDADVAPPPAGSPCQTNADCGAGHHCLDQATWGIAGGYCSQVCDPTVPSSCGAGTVCQNLIVDPQFAGTQAHCLPTCQADADCGPGTACRPSFLGDALDSPDIMVCAPGNPTSQLGDPCVSSADCQPGWGYCDTQVTGGLCRLFGCQTADPTSCPAGSECLQRSSPAFSECFPTCSSTGTCGPHETCSSALGGTPYCLVGSATAQLGDACTDGSQCPPPFTQCLTDTDPGGFCTRYCDPTQAGACGAGAECLALIGGGGFCLRNCASSAECRTGYQCVAAFTGQATQSPTCVPGLATSVPLGHECQSDGDCEAGYQYCGTGRAFLDGKGPPVGGGYCTASCDPQASATCGTGAVCGPFYECLSTCSSDADCVALRTPGSPGTITCSTRLVGADIGASACILSTPGAHIGDPCAAYKDCPPGSFCRADNPLVSGAFVNGYCSDLCDPTAATSTCGAGTVCVNADPTNAQFGLCWRSCTSTSDCRTADGYQCVPVNPDIPAMGSYCSPGM
jgi:hypothetical protein